MRQSKHERGREFWIASRFARASGRDDEFLAVASLRSETKPSPAVLVGRDLAPE
jgi:hypothetical protein